MSCITINTGYSHATWCNKGLPLNVRPGDFVIFDAWGQDTESPVLNIHNQGGKDENK